MRNKKNKADDINKKTFTIIDVFVCLILVLTVVYVAVRFFKSEDSENFREVEYKVTFIMPEDKNEVFKKGDVVLTSNGEKSIGEILEVNFTPLTELHFDLTANSMPNDENNSSSSENSISNELDIEIELQSGDASDDNYVSEESVEESIDINDDYSENESSDDMSKNIIVESKVDGYIEVTVTVSAKILYDSDVYYLDSVPLKIGSEAELTTKYFSATGKCVSISEK